MSMKNKHPHLVTGTVLINFGIVFMVLSVFIKMETGNQSNVQEIIND